jgi:hypothetical protein
MDLPFGLLIVVLPFVENEVTWLQLVHGVDPEGQSIELQNQQPDFRVLFNTFRVSINK